MTASTTTAPLLPLLCTSMKTTEGVDMVTPLRKYITDHYEQDGSNFNEQLKRLNGLREATRSLSKGMDDSSIAVLYKYYAQLELTELRFPLNESGVRLSWTWSDVFTLQTMSQYSAAFEKANLLFNIGSLLMTLACKQNRLSNTGLKQAAHYCTAAAGVFLFISENFMHAPQVDISRSSLLMFSALAQAQAQECFLKKSIMDVKSSSLVCKLSIQLSQMYEHVSSCMSVSPLLNHVDKAWVLIVQAKTFHFRSIAYYNASVDANMNHLYGDQCGYLNGAKRSATDALKLTKASGVATMLSKAGFSDLSVSLQENLDFVSQELAVAQRDNETVYHERVPTEGDLVLAPGIQLAKVLPFPSSEKLAEYAGPDVLLGLVPLVVTKAASLYSEDVAKLMRQLVESVETKDIAVADSLCLMKLPQALDDALGGLPPLTTGIQCINDSLIKDGEPLTTSERLASLLEQGLRTSEALNSVAAALAADEAEEEAIHAACSGIEGTRHFTPTPSAANRFTRVTDETAQCRDVCSAAGYADQKLKRLFSSVYDNLALASLAPSLLRRKLFKSNDIDSGSNLIDSPPVDEALCAKIRNLLAKNSEMASVRVQMLTALREKIRNDDITGILLRSPQSQSHQQRIIESELHKYDGDFIAFEAHFHKQDKLLRDLVEANGLFVASRETALATDDRGSERAAALISANETLLEIQGKVREGMEFYAQLSETTRNLRETTAEVILARKSDRERLSILMQNCLDTDREFSSVKTRTLDVSRDVPSDNIPPQPDIGCEEPALLVISPDSPKVSADAPPPGFIAMMSPLMPTPALCSKPSNVCAPILLKVGVPKETSSEPMEPRRPDLAPLDLPLSNTSSTSSISHDSTIEDNVTSSVNSMITKPPLQRQLGNVPTRVDRSKDVSAVAEIDTSTAVQVSGMADRLRNVVSHLGARVRRMSIDCHGRSMLSRDYYQLAADSISEAKAKGLTSTRSRLVAPNKNRYADVVPWDQTAVKLTTSAKDNIEDSSYINASHIRISVPRGLHYIATQGPLPHTVGDFWRMIWEQGVRRVVMLTELVENGRSKCSLYWPKLLGDTTVYGDYWSVSYEAEEKIGTDIDIRRFRLSYVCSGADAAESRVVTQFHYRGWPDHGVPTSPDSFLDFVDKCDAALRCDEATDSQQAFSWNLPVVVHCSAGIGRTGVFIVVLSLLIYMRDSSSKIDIAADIYSFVGRLRQSRPGMVQTEGQYEFCYSALLTAFGSMQRQLENTVCTGGNEAISGSDGDIYLSQSSLEVDGIKSIDRVPSIAPSFCASDVVDFSSEPSIPPTNSSSESIATMQQQVRSKHDVILSKENETSSSAPAANVNLSPAFQDTESSHVFVPPIRLQDISQHDLPVVEVDERSVVTEQSHHSSLEDEIQPQLPSSTLKNCSEIKGELKPSIPHGDGVSQNGQWPPSHEQLDSFQHTTIPHTPYDVVPSRNVFPYQKEPASQQQEPELIRFRILQARQLQEQEQRHIQHDQQVQQQQQLQEQEIHRQMQMQQQQKSQEQEHQQRMRIQQQQQLQEQMQMQQQLQLQEQGRQQQVQMEQQQQQRLLQEQERHQHMQMQQHLEEQERQRQVQMQQQEQERQRQMQLQKQQQQLQELERQQQIQLQQRQQELQEQERLRQIEIQQHFQEQERQRQMQMQLQEQERQRLMLLQKQQQLERQQQIQLQQQQQKLQEQERFRQMEIQQQFQEQERQRLMQLQQQQQQLQEQEQERQQQIQLQQQQHLQEDERQRQMQLQQHTQHQRQLLLQKQQGPLISTRIQKNDPLVGRNAENLNSCTKQVQSSDMPVHMNSANEHTNFVQKHIHINSSSDQSTELQAHPTSSHLISSSHVYPKRMPTTLPNSVEQESDFRNQRNYVAEYVVQGNKDMMSSSIQPQICSEKSQQHVYRPNDTMFTGVTANPGQELPTAGHQQSMYFQSLSEKSLGTSNNFPLQQQQQPLQCYPNHMSPSSASNVQLHPQFQTQQSAVSVTQQSPHLQSMNIYKNDGRPRLAPVPQHLLVTPMIPIQQQSLGQTSLLD